MVSVAEFESATPTPPEWCATRLRYTEMKTFLTFAENLVSETGFEPAGLSPPRRALYQTELHGDRKRLEVEKSWSPKRDLNPSTPCPQSRCATRLRYSEKDFPTAFQHQNFTMLSFFNTTVFLNKWSG